MLRFSKEEVAVKKQDIFKKTSYAYSKNCGFRALDVALNLDVPVLLIRLFFGKNLATINGRIYSLLVQSVPIQNSQRVIV